MLIRVEPSLFRADEAWFIFDDGRQLLRKIDREEIAAKSDFPCPAILKDAIDPCRGMDGRIYDSLSGYRRTLRPDGNPQGERYTEIGDEEIRYEPPQFDEGRRRDDIRHALMDIKYGRVPPPAPTPDPNG